MVRALDPDALLMRQRAQWQNINPAWAAQGPEVQLTSRGTPVMVRSQRGVQLMQGLGQSDGLSAGATAVLLIGGAFVGMWLVRRRR